MRGKRTKTGVFLGGFFETRLGGKRRAGINLTEAGLRQPEKSDQATKSENYAGNLETTTERASGEGWVVVVGGRIDSGEWHPD